MFGQKFVKKKRFWPFPFRVDIDNPDRLKRGFAEISIAPGDRLFIDGIEVLPSEHPELFKRPEVL